MNTTAKTWALFAVKALLTLAFFAAGTAKLMGVPMLVHEFDLVGLGQWFRYVTGLLEVGAALAIWVPGKAAFAAGLMVCITVGALIAHATVLGFDTAAPAAVLLVLSALILWANRAQVPVLARAA